MAMSHENVIKYLSNMPTSAVFVWIKCTRLPILFVIVYDWLIIALEMTKPFPHGDDERVVDAVNKTGDPLSRRLQQRSKIQYRIVHDEEQTELQENENTVA
jgi:hypothetical protein